MIAVKKDLMKIFTFRTRAEMGRAAADACAQAVDEVLKRKPEVNIVFAAAPSQSEFLETFFKMNIDFSKINALHMDEYVGFNSDDSRSFAYFLKNYFDRVALKSVHYINTKDDLTVSCAGYSEVLKKYKPDIICMGIGENGHIAFNDPVVADFNDKETIKVVELEETCRIQQVNDKCFENIDAVPRYALTLTIPALMSAAHIICTVPGGRKADAVRKTVCGKIDETCPASILRKHGNVKMFLDSDSAAGIADDVLSAG